MRHDEIEVDPRFLELDFASSDSRNVEEIVKQTRHVSNLPSRDVERLVDHRSVLNLKHQDLKRVRERSERIAQFVGQHREEFVLAPGVLIELFGLPQELHFQLFSLGDIRDEAKRAVDRVIPVSQRVDGHAEPTVPEGKLVGFSFTRYAHSFKKRLPFTRGLMENLAEVFTDELGPGLRQNRARRCDWSGRPCPTR